MLRPVRKKTYKNSKKNSVRWGPKNAPCLADLWTQIESERNMCVGTNSAAVENCASLAQIHLAQSMHIFSSAIQDHNKCVKCLSHIGARAAGIQLL